MENITEQEQVKKVDEQAEQDRVTIEKRRARVDEFFREIQTRKFEPVPTGFRAVDKALSGGLYRQTLVMLGAAPGIGKTSLTQMIFESMARKGHDVLYINLEMSAHQMMARSISRICALGGFHMTSTDVLQGYRWTPAQRESMNYAIKDYRENIAPHMVYNPESLTTGESVSASLTSLIEQLEKDAKKYESMKKRVPFIVIDYLQLVRGEEREDAMATMKRAVFEFKKFAIQHDTTVFCIIAHSREDYLKGAVNLGSGRDTSAIEYSADVMLGIVYTNCKGEEEEKKAKAKFNIESQKVEKLVTLKVIKSRFGSTNGKVDLIFNGADMTFRPAEGAKKVDPPDNIADVFRDVG